VSERIASLRGVKDCEVRLADAIVAATGVARQKQESGRSPRNDRRVGRRAAAHGQAERLRVVRDDAGVLGATVPYDTRVRAHRSRASSVEAVARDLASLSGTHEAVRDDWSSTMATPR